MASKEEGKEIAGNAPDAGGRWAPCDAPSCSSFSRRRKAVISGPSGVGRLTKRRRPGVLQFYEDAASEGDDQNGLRSDEDEEDMRSEYERIDLSM